MGCNFVLHILSRVFMDTCMLKLKNSLTIFNLIFILKALVILGSPPNSNVFCLYVLEKIRFVISCLLGR